MKFSLQSTYICRLKADDKPEGIPTSVKALDRVILLIPQSSSLYREFEYEREYVSKAELEECINNDILQISPWPEVDKYYLTAKTEEKWQVKVWIWRRYDHNTVTHAMPEMAFKLGCVPAGTLCFWQDEGGQYACLRQADGLPGMLWPLHHEHQKRRFTSWLQQTSAVEQYFAEASEPPEAITYPVCQSLRAQPDFTWLKAAQKENAIDISSPWGLKNLWSSALVLLVVWAVATFSLIYWKETDLEYGAEADSLQLQQLQRQRSELTLYVKRTEALATELSAQQRLPGILNTLAEKLPQDVILSRFSFNQNKIELEGTADNTNGLLESLETVEGVNSARFISDITRTRESKQRFSIELVLKQGTNGV